MKDLEKIKNEVAVKHGYYDWAMYEMDFRQGLHYADLTNEVATEFARQMCDVQIQDCYLNAKVKTISESVFDNNEGGYFYRYKVVVCQASILNTPNVVKP